MKGITTMLWFDDQAEDAANFYVSLFPNSTIDRVARYGEAGPGVAGTVMTIEFTLDGTTFVGLNGGPVFEFTDAVSFVINCETQEEVDHYWDALIDGGTAQQCGWLSDRFGVVWQVVPIQLGRWMGDPDPEKAKRVTEAMLQMIKLDIPTLEAAYRGE